MKTEHTFIWERNTSTNLPNLHVLKNNGVEIGFIYKPKDTNFDKNAWRLHKGIGIGNVFLGHEWTLNMAKRGVEKHCI